MPALHFDLATASDDAELRRLLRDNPMEGRVRIALEREPDSFLAATIEGDVHQVIVARDEHLGRLVGMGSRSVADAWVNGRPARLGYLSQLRADPVARARPRALRAGYAKLRELHADGATSLYVTTIVEDNHRARRVLEAGIEGLPTYRPVGSLVTLILPARRRRPRPVPGVTVDRSAPGDLDAIVDRLERSGRRYQFARRWTRGDLESPERTRELDVGDFYTVRRAGRPVGCLARWDQRAFKQSVIAGYDRSLAVLRPFVNLARPWLRTPRLPRPGETLRSAFLSHLAADEDDPAAFVRLVAQALGDAARDGLDALVLGLSRDHPLLPAARRSFPHRAYVSIVYVVHWEDGAADADRLDGRVPHLEVATL